MTKTEFQQKLDEASRIVESWPDWKKHSLKDSFRSRNSVPRPEVKLPTAVDDSSSQEMLSTSPTNQQTD